MDKKERESHVKKIEKEEQKKCPFDPKLACEDCRLFIFISKSIGKQCSVVFSAIRSF